MYTHITRCYHCLNYVVGFALGADAGCGLKLAIAHSSMLLEEHKGGTA